MILNIWSDSSQVKGRGPCYSKKGEKREGGEEEREQREEEREASDHPVSLHLWTGPCRHCTQNRCITPPFFHFRCFSVECNHAQVQYRWTSSFTVNVSLCSGWRGATDLHDSTTSPVCKLVKKEKKDSEEDEDEILCKLKRDDVSSSCGCSTLKQGWDILMRHTSSKCNRADSWKKENTWTKCTREGRLMSDRWN